MSDFDAFFKKATGGDDPFDFQRELALAERPPAVLSVPTGCGKTRAILVAWLYRRLVLGRGPRRLVYALPMRSLVEQTAVVARDLKDRLGSDAADVGIHVLMGGELPEQEDWRLRPDANQILVGTIDMLLSRALNRGYAESRFVWPISFGLLNSDAAWVFDEVQLMGPARVTSAQLHGLRAKLGTALPCESTWVSATLDRQTLLTYDHPQLDGETTLSERDRTGRLKRRLEAEKRLERVDLTAAKPAALARAIARAVLDAHRASTRSIVVVNRVELAQDVAQALARLRAAPEVVLLHSRFRPADRERQMQAALAPVDLGPGRIVVSTQVIEAGVDTSAALLATETAPFSSIVQRLGRCNRIGDDDPAVVLWLDRGDLDARQAAPYDPRDIAAARAALEGLVGSSLSPVALERLDPVEEVAETWAVLRRRHLLDLFDTTPDLSGLDVDVSRYIRPDDDRTVSVFFRETPAADVRRPEPQELVSVPIGALGDRRAWQQDHVTGVAVPVRGAAIRPGATVMLAAGDGGYDPELGWRPSSRDPVAVVGPVAERWADAIDLDLTSGGTSDWVELSDHLAAAESVARTLIDRLPPLDAPADAADAVVCAAAVHDIGKAHAVFRGRLLTTLDDDEEVAQRAGTLWAKSKRRAGRPRDGLHFRHELASLLVLLTDGGSALLPPRVADLVRYLVLAHHGKVRLTVRSVPADGRGRQEDGRMVLGVRDGDLIEAVATPRGESPAVRVEIGLLDAVPSWTERACALRDDPALGPFRLGYLEALVRVADWSVSG